jgi:DNA polymerase (family 10)
MLTDRDSHKQRVAAVLEEMSLLLELTGANPFKSRAYANGARAVQSLDEDLETLLEEDRLRAVKGIGKNIAVHVAEIVRDESFAEYEDLKASVPAGLLDVLRIPGLGAKKVRTLWKEIGVTGPAELEAAARGGQLRDLAGFGRRSEEKILEGIAQLEQYAGRFLWHHAYARAVEFERLLHEHPKVQRVSVAGSLRRRMETVHDADLLAAVDERDRDEVMTAFVEAPVVERVMAKGATKSSVLTAGGLTVDLRAVTDREFPFALHHFTGSKEHNTLLRGRAKKRGLKMSEWGVFRGDERLSAANEEEVLGLVGLPWIPPELREDQGEIDAADAGGLPVLLEPEDLRGVLHVHTTYSDGRNTLREMVEAAQQRGWTYLGISDHSQTPVYANGLPVERVREQHREIDELRREFPDFSIFKGIESDILDDGSLDYDDDLLATFDFVIASVHSRLSMPRARMTERILTAIRHPAVTILGHPTGRQLLTREPYELDVERVLVEAGRLGVSVELNATPRRLDLDWRWCRRAVAEGILISIGPDAHRVDGLDHTLIGVGVARKGWLTAGDVLNCRGPEELREHFDRRRRAWQPLAGRRSRWSEDGELLS